MDNSDIFSSFFIVVHGSYYIYDVSYIGCTSGSTNVEGSLKDIKEQGAQSKSDQTRLIKKDDASYFSPRNRLETDQSAFKVYKGVKTFAFSKQKNVIVTGG